MTQTRRIVIGLAVLVLLGGGIFALEYFRGQAGILSQGALTLEPGSVPIYFNGQLAAGFTPAALDSLQMVSFVDAEEGKPQDGWMLRDVLLTYLPELGFGPGTRITVSSSSRKKSVELTWTEVENEQNMVIFDLSNRGTLKLVSLLERLDTRDEWVQDVDRIEVGNP